MPRMTRTQVTLEEDEYLCLKARAAEGGRSLSSVVRGLVRMQMDQAPYRVAHIWDLAGIVTDCDNSEASGKHHDQIIADALAAEFGLDDETL